jgi:TolB-like protein/Tfp pilus assembly protein PilF
VAPPVLFQRLKDRKLTQWGVAYLAGAFVAFQVMDALAEPLSLSDWAQRAVLTLVVAGFFLTLVLAWYHGEKGQQRVSGPELLMVALLLFIAGLSISLLPGDEETAEPAALSDLARFATLDDDRPTIAVLPLANLSADEENSYLAAGIHEELLRLLSLVRSLGIISRTSVLQYAGVDKNIREIAAELGARYIVEGSVQENQGRVRIQAQLIDATTDQHLWAERYDRSLVDIFQLQSEVAEAIARALEAVVTPGEQERLEARPTQDPLAYDLYLRSAEYSSRGYSSSKENYDARIELLRQATRLDPDFALAHASLAHVFGEGQLQHGYPPPDSALARAERALALDPQLPKAHAAKGWVLTFMGQFEAARASLQRAVTLDPSMAYAWTGLSLVGHISGDFVAGALAARRGLQADRSYSTAALHLGYSLMGAGMYDEAALWYAESATWWGLFGLLWNAVSAGDLAAAQGHAGRMLEQYPDNLLALYNAAAFEAIFGNPENAETILGQVADLAPELTINGMSTPEVLLAWIQAQSGQPEGRERLERLRLLRMEQVEQDETSLQYFGDLSLIATVLGDDDELLRIAAAIQRLDQNDQWYVLRDSRIYDSIRDYPEVQAWLQEAEERKAAQRRELVLLGPWTPEGLLRTGNRSPGGD